MYLKDGHLDGQNTYVLGTITGGISPNIALFLPVFSILRGVKYPLQALFIPPYFYIFH